MGLKNKKNKIIYSIIKKYLNLILARIWLIKFQIKEFICDHIVSIFIIGVLLILLMVNVSIRNQRIEELETKVNELKYKIYESEIILNDSLAQ